MNRAGIAAWMRQTSTIAGVSTIVGALAGIYGGQLTWSSATPLFLGAVSAIMLPGNTPTVQVRGPNTTVNADVAEVQAPPGSTTTVRQ